MPLTHPAKAPVNPVVMMAYNQLDLTKDALMSVLAQDVPNLHVYFIDNGSSDGTRDWVLALNDPRIVVHASLKNISPVIWANQAAYAMFCHYGYDYWLGVPNDVILPSNLYRLMLEIPRGIVTASMTAEKNFPRFEKATAVNECTPMAVALIRKWVYDALVAKDGYFLDPGYWHYASDCDFALRLAACGIHGVQLDVQYWHHGSATWRLAQPEEAQAMVSQADRDREYFQKKWGFRVDDPQYGESAGNINFRGVSLLGKESHGQNG